MTDNYAVFKHDSRLHTIHHTNRANNLPKILLPATTSELHDSIYLTHHPTAASTKSFAYTLCSIPGTPPSGSSFGVVVTASNDIALSLNSASCRCSFNSAVRAKKLSRSRGRSGVSFGDRQPRKSNSVGDFSRTRK